jgi:hypothetical protein
MEFCVALVISGVSFLVGALGASAANPSEDYVGFYIAGGALVLSAPAGILAFAVMGHIRTRVRMAARRSSLRFAICDERYLASAPGKPLAVQGQNVDRLTRNVLALWNKGPQTIHNDDLRSSIRFQLSGELLAAPHVLCRDGGGVRFTHGYAREVVAEFDVLQAGEGATAEIIDDGYWRPSLTAPWDGLQPRLRIWPIALIFLIAQLFEVVLHFLHGVFLWFDIAFIVVAVGAALCHPRQIIVLWGVRFGSPRRQVDLDYTDLWLRRVPKPLRDTTSSEFADTFGL